MLPAVLTVNPGSTLIVAALITRDPADRVRFPFTSTVDLPALTVREVIVDLGVIVIAPEMDSTENWIPVPLSLLTLRVRRPLASVRVMFAVVASVQHSVPVTSQGSLPSPTGLKWVTVPVSRRLGQSRAVGTTRHG